MTEQQMLSKIAEDVGYLRATNEIFCERLDRHETALFGNNNEPGVSTRLTIVEGDTKSLKDADQKLAAAHDAARTAWYTTATSIAVCVVTGIFGLLTVIFSNKPH